MIALGGEALVLTHDTMVEGVHYLAGQDPADVAWKLVACNMSDLAAKGAEPLGVLLGYMFGRDDARFLEGLAEALAHFGAPLLGGDTVSGGSAQVLGLTAIGRATCTAPPSRAGARASDALWITGPVGAAMIGCEALVSGNADPALTQAYRRPEALLAQGRALAPHVSAMMDVSDGVLLDAARMARASGVTFAIESANVPLAAPEHRRADALRWGDDYQLLFAARADAVLPSGCGTRIGVAVAQGRAPLLLDGVPLGEADGLGYEHR